MNKNVESRRKKKKEKREKRNNGEIEMVEDQK